MNKREIILTLLESSSLIGSIIFFFKTKRNFSKNSSLLEIAWKMDIPSVSELFNLMNENYENYCRNNFIDYKDTALYS